MWEINDYGQAYKAFNLWFLWENSYDHWNFDRDWLIQNFVTWEDPSEPGKDAGMSCNVVFKEMRDGSTNQVHILNYAGVNDLAGKLGTE